MTNTTETTITAYYPNTGWTDNDLNLNEAARDYLIWLTDEAQKKGVLVKSFVESCISGDPEFTDENGENAGDFVWTRVQELYPNWVNGLKI